MAIGSKIKEFRNKAGLTQKDLADQLNVTYQAVSRWENEEVEPSIDTIKDLCKILDCSIEDLFEMGKKEDPFEDVEQPATVEHIIVQETKPVLGVCEQCNKPIYEPSGMHRIQVSQKGFNGEFMQTQILQKLLCQDCYEQHLVAEKKEKKKKQAEKEERLRSKRTHAFIWPGLILCILLIIGIKALVSGETTTGIVEIVAGIFGFTFVACLILDNNFIMEMWLAVLEFGFVKMPGVIFDCSLDGLVFLITVKLVFFLIGLALSIFAFVVATALAMALSIFVYPFALRKNLRGIED